MFPFVAPMCPERHLDAAELLGSEVRNPKKADAGKITADVMRKFMEDVSKIYYEFEFLNNANLCKYCKYVI